MKIDYNKYVGKKLHPKLKEIMTEVFCKMPQLTFRATDAHPHEGVIIEVDAFEKIHKVGSIEVSREAYRGDEMKDVIKVTSHLIKKQRGATNVVATINAKRAISKCLEVFKPKEVNEVVDKLVKEVDGDISNMIWSYDRHAPNINHVQASILLLAYAKGEPIPIEKEEADKPIKGEEAINNARIARKVGEQFKNKFGAIVRLEYDDSLSFLELAGQELKNLASTYDLPVNYQEKLAILKIMEPDQPIQNIGVRFECSYNNIKTFVFFLVGGDTIPQ